MKLRKRNIDYFEDLSRRYWEEEERMRSMLIPQSNEVETPNYSLLNTINMEDYYYLEIDEPATELPSIEKPEIYDNPLNYEKKNSNYIFSIEEDEKERLISLPQIADLPIDTIKPLNLLDQMSTQFKSIELKDYDDEIDENQLKIYKPPTSLEKPNKIDILQLLQYNNNNNNNISYLYLPYEILNNKMEMNMKYYNEEYIPKNIDLSSLNESLNMYELFPDEYMNELYNDIKIYNTIEKKKNKKEKSISIIIDLLCNDNNKDNNNNYKYIDYDSILYSPLPSTTPSIINSLSLGIYFTKYKPINTSNTSNTSNTTNTTNTTNNNKTVLNILSELYTNEDKSIYKVYDQNNVFTLPNIPFNDDNNQQPIKFNHLSHIDSCYQFKYININLLQLHLPILGVSLSFCNDNNDDIRIYNNKYKSIHEDILLSNYIESVNIIKQSSIVISDSVDDDDDDDNYNININISDDEEINKPANKKIKLDTEQPQIQPIQQIQQPILTPANDNNIIDDNDLKDIDDNYNNDSYYDDIMMLYSSKKLTTTKPSTQISSSTATTATKPLSINIKLYYLNELQLLSDPIITYLKENNYNISSNLVDIESSELKKTIESTQLKLKNNNNNNYSKIVIDELIKSLQYLIYLNLLRVLVEYNNNNNNNNMKKIIKCIDNFILSDNYKSLLLPSHLYELNSLKNKLINGDIIINNNNNNNKNRKQYYREIRIYISEKELQNDKLINILINNYNVKLLDRSVAYPIDFIIDECTGICIINKDIMESKEQILSLYNELLLLILKYKEIYCFIYLPSSISFPYFSGIELLMNYCLPLSSYLIFRYVINEDDICHNIRDIIDYKSNKSNVWKIDEYYNREWLFLDECVEDYVLSNIPYLNLFSAGVILACVSLRKFINMSEREMIEKIPFINPDILINCYRFTRKDFHFDSEICSKRKILSDDYYIDSKRYKSVDDLINY